MIGAAQEKQFPKLGGKTMPSVEPSAFRQAIKFNVPDAREFRVLENVSHQQ